MSGGGSKPGERRGGRQKGTPNKATVERVLRAERAVAESKAAGRKLAVETLDHYMHDFLAIAAGFREHGDLAAFERWAVLAVQTAKDLAPYQSPKLSAVVVGSAAVTKIEVIGGLPDDQDGSFIASPAITPASADSSIPETAQETAVGS
jgi:hypothetical protein